MKRFLQIPALLLISFFVLCLSCKGKQEGNAGKARDLEQIRDSSELIALTLSSSVSYFIYKGEPMGYEYELLKGFADSLGVKLTIKVAENVGRLTEMLENGEGDIIGYHIPVTNEMKSELNYCGQEIINEQVLIQRANKGDTVLTDVTELIGKEVRVLDGSKYYNRLVNLNQELGGGIRIKDIGKDTISVEDLIGYVADGTIQYTLSDNDIARLNRTYYPNINISLVVSHPQRSSWAVRKTAPDLTEAVNQWFKDSENKPRYQSIMKRYFEMSKMPGDEPVSILGNGMISVFDHWFKQYAVKLNWDWKLIASIAYQESSFDTTGVSWAGAAGLMGLMPRTAESFGITSEGRFHPEQSIRAGTNYLVYLKEMYSGIENDEEKIKFVLASYNAGPGHILDAQALATKYGKNPSVWKGNVEEYVKLKNLPEYYNDSVCKSGYFRGAETINYVEHIVERWNYYKEKVE